jgi:hypothetical protein
MSFTDWATIKAYKGFSDNTQQTAVEAIITRAQKMIESYCVRTFEAAADSTRYFTVGRDTRGNCLYLDRDLCAITTVKTNLDNGSSGETIPSTDYVTEPVNEAPYYQIEILGSSAYSWTYTTNRQKAISITGKWAYSTSAPADIVQACIRLTLYMYEQRNSQIFDTVAQPEMGIITVPKGIPADVKVLLEPYRRIA